MKKVEKKTELTEEEKKLAEERKEKRKARLLNGLKIVVGVVAFGVGALLVAASMGIATEASTELPADCTSEESSSDEVVCVDNETTESSETSTEE